MSKAKDSILGRLSPREYMEAVQVAYGYRSAPADQVLAARRGLTQSIHAFMRRPFKQHTESKKVQAFIPSTNVAQPITNTFDVMRNANDFDMFWTDAFPNKSDRLEANQDFYEVLVIQNSDVANSGDTVMGWGIVPEGAPVRMTSFKAELQSVKIKKFGSGYEIPDEFIRFRKLGAIQDLAAQFREGAMTDIANRFYSALTVAGSGTVDTASAEVDIVDKNIDLLNTSALALLTALKNTRRLTTTAELLLYCPVSAQSAINQVLTKLTQAVAGSSRKLVYNIRPIFTFNDNLPVAGTNTHGCILTTAGSSKTLKSWAEHMPITEFKQDNIVNLTQVTTNFWYYGGAVLDNTEVRTVELF